MQRHHYSNQKKNKIRIRYFPAFPHLIPRNNKLHFKKPTKAMNLPPTQQTYKQLLKMYNSVFPSVLFYSLFPFIPFLPPLSFRQKEK